MLLTSSHTDRSSEMRVDRHIHTCIHTYSFQTNPHVVFTRYSPHFVTTKIPKSVLLSHMAQCWSSQIYYSFYDVSTKPYSPCCPHKGMVRVLQEYHHEDVLRYSNLIKSNAYTSINARTHTHTNSRCVYCSI